jgi:uncharacterized membrane protein
MIGLRAIYLLTGLFLLGVSVRHLTAAHPRRWTSAAFWGLLAFAFLAGDRVPATLMGGVVLLLALLAGFGGVRATPSGPVDAAELRGESNRLGNRIFLPALAIPALTLVGVLGLKRIVVAGRPLLDPSNATLVSLGLACVFALALALRTTGGKLSSAMAEGGRLADAIGWAAILPLYLATLGAVFAKAGVGEAVASILTRALPLGSPTMAVLAYGLGMAVFTIIMGNAFAAFPVITAGIGLPVLVGVHHANPAAMAALGMLTGYCGTLLTPMAANYNLVPAALLELHDPHAVIKAQVPTALALFVTNLVLMRVLIFL